MVHRYLEYVKKIYPHLQDDGSILLHQEIPDQFIAVLRRILKPYSVKNHAASLASCLDLLLTDHGFRQEIGLGYASKPKIREAKEIWVGLKSSVERQARGLQRAKLRAGVYKNVPVSSLFDFLLINQQKVEAILNSSEEHGQQPTYHDFELIQAYCSIILLLHGQRLCAALKITSKSVLNPAWASGLIVLRIPEHKSRRSHGPAAVAMKELHYRAFAGLAKLKIALEGPASRLLSAPPNRASKVLLVPVDRLLALTHPGWGHLTFNSLRVTVESNAYLASTSRIVESTDAISSYLLHSKKTSDLHYSYRSDERIAAESRQVQDILSQLVLMDLARNGQLNAGLNQGNGLRIALHIIVNYSNANLNACPQMTTPLSFSKRVKYGHTEIIWTCHLRSAHQHSPP
jgi:hypothetical protein